MDICNGGRIQIVAKSSNTICKSTLALNSSISIHSAESQCYYMFYTGLFVLVHKGISNVSVLLNVILATIKFNLSYKNLQDLLAECGRN